MNSPVRRALSTALALASLAAPAGGEEPSPAAGTGFAGTWALVSSRDDVRAVPGKSLWSAVGGAERPGGTGSLGSGGGFDLPIEVMTDARRLVVSDDGSTFVATYPSGRKRTFVTDGRTRYLDDGDGPADVTAVRKAATVTVASEWFRGYKLRETWEVATAPRRLVVTGRLKGKESQEYVRTYEPAPPGPVVTPTPSTPSPGTEEVVSARPADEAAPVPPLVDRVSDCTVRPPRNAAPAELSRLARIRQEAAGQAAIATVAPAKPTDVISSDLEVYEGCLVWPFTLRVPGRRGVQEVFVDAGDGSVVRSEFVPIAAQGPPSQP
jgi:hypothetical protein